MDNASLEELAANVIYSSSSRKKPTFTKQVKRIDAALQTLETDLACATEISEALPSIMTEDVPCYAAVCRMLEQVLTHHEYSEGIASLYRCQVAVKERMKRIAPPRITSQLARYRDRVARIRLTSPGSQHPVKVSGWINKVIVARGQVADLRSAVDKLQSLVDGVQREQHMLRQQSPRQLQAMVGKSEKRLTEMRLDGDRTVKALEASMAKLPKQPEEMPAYTSSLDRRDQLRKKITNMTVQLQLWIKKYDKVVGEPVKELEALEAKMTGFPEWKATMYDPQETLLQDLQQQIDELDAEDLEELILERQRLHAVRVLQRAWRKTLQRIHSRRKGKGKGKAKGKGKGKKAKRK